MADQDNNDIGVADTFLLMLEDSSFDGSERNPIVSNGVGKVQERAECEDFGISSCAVEQERGNGAEPIVVESTSVVEVDGEVRENLGVSSCNIEEGMGNITLVSGSKTSAENDAKGEIKMDEDDSGSSESESDNSSSPTSSSSSSSSDSDDSSSNGDSSDDDDSEDNEKEEQQDEEKRTEKIELEVEEGEIKDSDGQELGTDPDIIDDDDGDLERASRSGINDEDGDEDDTVTEGPITSKNELKDLPSVPTVYVTLEPHHQMLSVGVVMSIISSQVIVEGTEKHDPLNEGSILWMTERRTSLGLVDEIFGPVKNPYYVVRYNSENEIPSGVQVGASISFVPEFANHVLNTKDLYKKGYDASGLNDEEVSDAAEFSDDEKEAEYRKMQKMTRTGLTDKNPGKQTNNKKRAPKKSSSAPYQKTSSKKKSSSAVPPYPVASSSPMHNHEKFSPFSGTGQGPFNAATIVPPFLSPHAGPNLGSNGVWANGISFVQPQTALPPNGPLNHVSWFPGNPQNPHQLPLTGIPFQQQLSPNLGSLPGTSLPGVQPNIFAQPSGTSLPGVQPNIFAQPFYPQGFVGQNQMTFGMNFPQIQGSVSGGEQGILPYQMQSERNHNLQSCTIPGNLHAPNQVRPGASANRGRKTFHQRGRKGWRPTR